MNDDRDKVCTNPADDPVNELASKLFDRLNLVFYCDMRELTRALMPLCESPIEVMLGCAMFYVWRLRSRDLSAVIAASKEARDRAKSGVGGPIYLVPQFEFMNYRIDWAIFEGKTCIFAECDGHDFHERTKEQAARDRQKDRAIQMAGIPIMRFTGSEIYRDPVECALQVYGMLRRRAAA